MQLAFYLQDAQNWDTQEKVEHSGVTTVKY
jgi:hypothetical protein